ncbi:MAG: hypothetical protein WA004_15225 [Saprospiraceae bacterium]
MKKVFLGLIMLFLWQSALAQQFLLDKPIGAGDLTLFPDLKNGNNYYYMPNQIQLATHPDGMPMFSFVKYVRNTDSDANRAQMVTESDQAGGIIHAVVRLNVTNEQIKEAERALRRIKSSGIIVGPVIYKSGTVMLISSFNKEGGDVKRVVGLGTAPILEGQNVAISVHLTKEASDILWATFQTPTPDFSISFEMEIQGFLSPQTAEIKANWDQIYSHQAFQAAAATPMFSTEITGVFEELRQKGAIKVIQVGGDAQIEKLVEIAYNQLSALMFDKADGSGVPSVNNLIGGTSQKSMLDRATENLNKYRKEAIDYNTQQEKVYNENMKKEELAKSKAQNARDSIFRAQGKTFVPPPKITPKDTINMNKAKGPDRMPIPSLSVALSYRMKKVKRSGEYTFSLNKYTLETRMNRFDQNFGSLISLSNCPSCFLRINLDDPLYKQRQVFVRVDGSINNDDFGKYINSVEVLLRKTHQDGSVTLEGLQINKKLFNEQANNFALSYGWQGDDNRNKWLAYEYKTKWSYFGGVSTETDWTSQEMGVLALAPDYIRKPVFVEGDLDFFQQEKILVAEVNLFYTVNGKEMSKRIVIKPREEELSKVEEVILMQDSNDFEFEIAYYIKGQEKPIVISRQKSNYGRIYLQSF